MSYFNGQFLASGRLYIASEHDAEWRRDFANRIKLEARTGVVVVLWIHGFEPTVYYGDEEEREVRDGLVASGGIAFISSLKNYEIGTHEVPWKDGIQAMAVADDGRVIMAWTEGDFGNVFPSPYETLDLLQKRGICVVHELSAAANDRVIIEEQVAEAKKLTELERLRTQRADCAFQLTMTEAWE
jgi:hypothetical protein